MSHKRSTIGPQKTHNRKGFTIIEMMIVTFIIGILTSIAFDIYFRERDRFEFNNALVQTKSIIKLARNLSTTNKSVTVGSGVSRRVLIPTDGYGIHINMEPGEEEPHFTLFANVDPSTPPGINSDDFPESLDANDVIIETYRLPLQIVMEYLVFDKVRQWNPGNETVPPTRSQTEAVIIYKPPLAETFLSDNSIPPEDYDGFLDLDIRFMNPAASVGAKKRCQYILINRIKTFPELTYTDCEEPVT